jgi:hypothetical protein
MLVATTNSRRYFLPLLIAFVFALAIHPTKTQAQIVGDLEVNIPFQFHVGVTKLPAGEYRIHVLDDSDLNIMEITSADGSNSALFQVQKTAASSTTIKGELIFNKYGDRYFLAQLFQEGSASGSQVVESRYEKRIAQKEASQAQEHVAARGPEQQGK